jgi:methanethiol S-methyltransferase
MSESPGYGLWSLVLVNSALFIFFAFSFFKPKTQRDWRSFGAFSAFVVALFAEMYGFPLTIYLLSGWLTTRFPTVDWFAHDSGHLLEMIFGPDSNPHLGPFHFLSAVLIGGGFWLLAAAWRRLYWAHQNDRLATAGPYARVRHPQYVGFALIMAGFLVQWPTLITAAMFPVLLVMYARLAVREEREVLARFGGEYMRYAEQTPRFFPRPGTTAAVAER